MANGDPKYLENIVENTYLKGVSRIIQVIGVAIGLPVLWWIGNNINSINATLAAHTISIDRNSTSINRLEGFHFQ